MSIDSLEDEIVNIIKKVQKKYPNVEAKIVESQYCNYENPKVKKLYEMEQFATGELYCISDANIIIENDTLTNLVFEYIKSDSKMIFSPISAWGSTNLDFLMENSYMNFFVSGNIIAGWKLFNHSVKIKD